jgi:hypothetical protein
MIAPEAVERYHPRRVPKARAVDNGDAIAVIEARR